MSSAMSRGRRLKKYVTAGRRNARQFEALSPPLGPQVENEEGAHILKALSELRFYPVGLLTFGRLK